METIFTYRSFQGIAKYKIIERLENGNLHLEDTTCTDHKNCEIEVRPLAEGRYEFADTLNESALRHHYIHEGQIYFTDEKECLLVMIESCLKSAENTLQESITELHLMHKNLSKTEEPKPLKPSECCSDKIVWIISNGDTISTKIIGRIMFSDNKTGWLTDSQYVAYEGDYGYVDGDRIILIDSPDKDGIVTTENGEVVYGSESDIKQLNAYKAYKQLVASIDRKKSSIDNKKEMIAKYKKILEEKDSLSCEEIKAKFKK